MKSVANFNNKDAVNIIECTKIFDEKRILNLRDINENKEGNNYSDDGETVLIDPRYFEIYFSVKFFEAITRGVWVQGEDPKTPPQYVLFTLDPTVLYLSQSSKNNFIQVVPRDSRSSKLFSLMEYTNYFFIEINQNKIKLSNNRILRYLNLINYDFADYLLLFLTFLINIIIFTMAESKDEQTDYQRIYKITLPLGVIQTAVSLLFIIIWSISKFWLYFTIEKEKYYISHRINKEENLSLPQYMDIIIFRTILSRREAVNFLWNLVFSIIGISSSRSLFIYSHSDLQLDKNAIKDVRHIRYGELAEITSIEDVQVSACRIYPNPTQDKLVIENAEGEKVYIFDINGRLLQTANLQNGNATLNVSPLPQGEYLLLLNTQTVKFIKH